MMEGRDDRRSAFITSYKEHRKGWGRSKGNSLNSNSINSNTSSLWSNDTSSTASGISFDACKHYGYQMHNCDGKTINPKIIIDSPDIHDAYMTSSSSLVSSSPISNDIMTSSHDNGPTSDTSTPEENLGTFPLNFRSYPNVVVRKSSDDDDAEGTNDRCVRQRKKANPRRCFEKRRADAPSEAMTCYSSPYPSSVTSSPCRSSTSDTVSESEKMENSTRLGLVDDLFNHNVDEKRKLFPRKSSGMLTSLEEDDVILELPRQETKEYGSELGSYSSSCNYPPRIPDQYKLTLNVSGKIFEVDSRKLDSYPQTLLGNPAKRMRFYDWRRHEFFFDRHRDTFEVILEFYNNGGVLRRPDDIPIDIFMNEVKFYSFDHDTLEQFLRDEGILHVPKQKVLPEGKMKKFIWQLFEDHESSCLSKFVTITSALVITVSVVVFCLETLPDFETLSHDVHANIGPAINACQYHLYEVKEVSDVHLNEKTLEIKYRRSIETANTSPVRMVLDYYALDDVTMALKETMDECTKCMNLTLQYRYTVARCLSEIDDERIQLDSVFGNSQLLDDTSPVRTSSQDSDPTEMTSPSRRRLRHKQESDAKAFPLQINLGTSTNAAQSLPITYAIESENEVGNTTAPSPGISEENVFFILNQACPILDELSRKTPYEWYVLEATMGSPAGILFITETACIVWFVFELTMRFLCCPSKLKFVKSFLNMVDAMAILPYFITLIVTTIQTKSSIRPQTATILRTIRLVRMLRILKLSRYSRGFRILGLTLIRSTRVLFLLVCFQVVLAVLFSSIVYFVEDGADGTQFHSIPDSFWWALITMTTVGYGDVVPITPMGKIAGACCAVMGILCISFPVPVVVSNFNYLYNLDRDDCKLIPEDLMEDHDEDRMENVDKFQENLFSAMKRSVSGITDEPTTNQNPAELWNVARKHFRKMSAVSIDARLEKSPSRSSSQYQSPAKPKMAIESKLEPTAQSSAKATSV